MLTTRACYQRGTDRLWAQIPCDAGSSPSKGPIYERGHRHERIQVQIEGGGPAGRVRDAEIRTPQFRDSQDGNPGRVPRNRREERLAGKGNLRKDEVSRRRGDGRSRGHLPSSPERPPPLPPPHPPPPP